MTTIAYRDGVMAADSLISTSSGRVLGGVQKIWSANGTLYGAAGSWPKVSAFRQWTLGDGKAWKDAIPCEEADSDAHSTDIFSVNASGKIFTYEAVICRPGGDVAVNWIPMEADFYAIGSGAAYAVGAMAHGATADEAIAVACKYDVSTGGRVRTLRLAEAA